MCFSFKTSIISYALGMISGVFAICTRQYVLGSLILAYCQMQLSEAIIWYGIDNNDTDINKFGTAYGKYLLSVHNLAIGIGIILSVLFISRRKLKITDFIPLILGTTFMLYIFMHYYSSNYSNTTYPLNNCRDKSCQNSENRLAWPFPHGWYGFSYAMSIVIMLIWIKPTNVKIF
jgi:hypothetical protein